MTEPDKIAALEQRIKQLEDFIFRTNVMWSMKDRMLSDSNLTETILDTLNSRVYVRSNVSLEVDQH